MANQDLVRGRQVVQTLTNQSGVSVTSGDVVIISTANDESFTTSTSSNYAGFIGVAQESISAGSNGRILIGGWAPSINVGANTVSRGQYLFHSTTAKTAIGAGFASLGAFGYVEKGGTGTTPTGIIFPPIQSAGSVALSAGSNSMDVSGSSAAGDLALNFVSPYNHRHKGVAAITSSSSNTLGTPIVNFRPGANIGLSATDTDGNGVFDTLIITGATQAAGGGGGAALTVTEEDGSPSISSVDTIKFPNGTVTDLGSGDVSIRQVPTGFIGCSVIGSTNTSLTTDVETPIPFDGTEVFDSDGFHNSASNPSRMTIPAGLGGKYLLTAGVTFNTNTTGLRYARPYKNGAAVGFNIQFVDANGSYHDTAPVVAVLDLAAGDYVEVAGVQGSGGSVAIVGGECWAMLTKLDSGKVGTGVGAKATRTTDQTGVVTDVATAVVFNGTDEFDTDGFHDPGGANPSRITIPTGLGGKYLLTATIIYDTSTAGTFRDLKFYKGGALAGGFVRDTPVNGYTIMTSSLVLDLTAAEYVEVFVQHDAGSNRTLSGSVIPMTFSIMRLDSGQIAQLSNTNASLAADVTMTTAGTFYDGPSVSLAAGTWLVLWKALFTHTGAQIEFAGKLWDGTTVYDEAHDDVDPAGTSTYHNSLSGHAIVTLTAQTTVKISVSADTNGQTLKRNAVFGSATSHTPTRISAVRIG